MRLWHYEILHYLPNSQLIAQWRELNSIYRKKDKHILINYIYEQRLNELYHYSLLVIKELKTRKIKIHSYTNFINFFTLKQDIEEQEILYQAELVSATNYPYPKQHNNRYLLQNFYNLQEKYDKGQKDFTEEKYIELSKFMARKQLIK